MTQNPGRFKQHPGPVDITMTVVGDAVELTVRDWGRWKPPTPTGNGGRGTPLMDALASSFTRTTDSTGTTVTCRLPLHAEERP